MEHLKWSDLPDTLLHSSAVKQAREAVRVGQSVLLIGPPGAARTMVARRLLLDIKLPAQNSLLRKEISMVYRLAGLEPPPLLTLPFRAPHHTASLAGMRGADGGARPGELSLAHGGILYLEEVAEFQPSVLEDVERAQLTHKVDFAAAWIHALPANFTLVASQQPCPCGWHGYKHPVVGFHCKCSEAAIERYMKRASSLITFSNRLFMPHPAGV